MWPVFLLASFLLYFPCSIYKTFLRKPNKQVLTIGVVSYIGILWMGIPMIGNYISWESTKPQTLLKEKEIHTKEEFAAGEKYLTLINSTGTPEEFHNEIQKLQVAQWGFDRQNHNLYYTLGMPSSPNSPLWDRTIPLKRGKELIKGLVADIEKNLENKEEAQKKLQTIFITGNRLCKQTDLLAFLIGCSFLNIGLEKLQAHPELKTPEIEKEVLLSQNADTYAKICIKEEFNSLRRRLDVFRNTTISKLTHNANTWKDFETQTLTVKTEEEYSQIIQKFKKNLKLKGQFFETIWFDTFVPRIYKIQETGDELKSKAEKTLQSI